MLSNVEVSLLFSLNRGSQHGKNTVAKKPQPNRRLFTVCRIKITETVRDGNYSGRYTDFEIIGLSISNLDGNQILKEVTEDPAKF